MKEAKLMGSLMPTHPEFQSIIQEIRKNINSENLI